MADNMVVEPLITGLVEINGLRNLMVYHNGSDDYLTISFELSENEMISYSLVDDKGKLIFEYPADRCLQGENDVRLDLNGKVKNGVYFLTVKSSVGRVVKKIIVLDK